MKKKEILGYIEKNSKWIVILFFSLLFLLGLFTFKDFGVSYDEKHNWDFGIGSYNLAFFGKDSTIVSGNQHGAIHSPFFELILVFAEKISGLRDIDQIFFMRHLLGFLLFFVAVIFFYKLCKIHFKGWKLALLGSLFLLLSPRIFASAFFNTVDLGAMCFFIFGIYTLVKLLNKITVPRAVLHGIVCAMAIDTRITALLIPVFTLLAITPLFLKSTWLDRKKNIFSVGVYLIVLVIFVIIFWPYLWHNPVSNFINSIEQTAFFKSTIENIYFGKTSLAGSVPWHFNLVWILITTPLLYITLFFIGLFGIFKSIAKNIKEYKLYVVNQIIFLLWFFVPIVAAIIFKTALYNGWRHHYFVYPAFLLISLTGLEFIFKSVKLKFKDRNYSTVIAILVIILVITCGSTAVVMLKYHPHENLYFNILTGGLSNAGKNFDIYWAFSYKNALEYILENDNSKTIKIAFSDNRSNNRSNNSIVLFPKNQIERLKIVGRAKANYFLTNNLAYRGKPGNNEKEFYSEKIGGTKIIIVYKNEALDGLQPNNK